MTFTVGPSPTNARLTQQFIDANNCTHNIYINLNNNYFDQVTCPTAHTYAGPLGIIPFTGLEFYIGGYKTRRNMDTFNTLNPTHAPLMPIMAPVENMRMTQHTGSHCGGRHR